MLQTEKNMKIIAISGGGIMGVGPSNLLRLLEKDIGSPIHRYIDGVAGTSTGSIIAGGIAFGDSMASIHSLYINKSAEIFKKRPFPYSINPFGAKYEISHLRKILKTHFRNRKMSHCKIPIWIPVSDMAEATELVWNDQDSVNMEYAVSCSCAAPTYFHPIDNRYADGGLVANDPSMVGVAGMVKRIGTPLNKISVLTLNTTGNTKPSIKPKSWWTKLNWVGPLINFQLGVSEETVQYMIKNLGLDETIYISPNFHCEIDDYKKVGECSAIWENVYTENKEKLLNWILKE